MSPTWPDPVPAAGADPPPSRRLVPDDAWRAVAAEIREHRAAEAGPDPESADAPLRARLDHAETLIAAQRETIRAHDDRRLRAERRADEQRQAAADRERLLLARIERLRAAVMALAQEVAS